MSAESDLEAGGRPVLRRRAALLGLAIGVPVSGVFLWLAVRGTDVGEVRSALGDAHPLPLVLAEIAFAAMYGTQAERWRRIAAAQVPWRSFAGMVLGAVACNNVLPARIGDLLRARWLGRAADVAAGRALATVVLDRASDILVLFVFLLVSLPEVVGAGWSRRLAVSALVVVVLVAAVLVFARVYARRRHRDRLASRSLPRRVLRDVVDGLAQPMGRRRLVLAVGLSVLAWSAFALAAVLVARSVGVRLGVLDALFATAVLNLGVAIPSSPGFVGTYQWLGVASLGALGVGRSPALAFAILLQAAWYVPTTLAGAGLLAWRGSRTVAVSGALVRSRGGPGG